MSYRSFFIGTGESQLIACVHCSQDLRGVEMTSAASTAAYCCLLTSDGELMYGVADNASHQLINQQLVRCMTVFSYSRAFHGSGLMA